MTRNRYFLSSNPNGGWDLKQEGAKHATRHFDTKQKGLDFSRSFVRGRRNSQLVIKRGDGEIQTEHTYGDDPRRHPG